LGLSDILYIFALKIIDIKIKQEKEKEQKHQN